MRNGVCPKCECTVIVQGARVLDRGHHGKEYDLSVAAYARPNAWLFKGKVTSELWACVCGACGYTELYATNLNELVRASLEGQKGAPSDAPREDPPDDQNRADDSGDGPDRDGSDPYPRT